MPEEPTDWKQITPEQLIPVVQHLRKSFDESDWKCSELTKKLCYAALHPSTTDAASLIPYNEPFAIYRNIIGRTGEQKFDGLIKIGTPPSVFRAYLDAFLKGMEVEVHDKFNLILDVGLANAEILGQHPIEWTKSQLRLMIRDDTYRVVMWIKAVCDKQESFKSDTDEEFGEWALWKTWRAPKLIHMHPAGNTSYDPATAWVREDEHRTKELLDHRSHRFSQFLEIDLEKIAGEAYVRLALDKGRTLVPQPQRTHAKGSENTPDLVEAERLKASEFPKPVSTPGADPGQNARSNRGTAFSPLLSKYRSAVKRAILVQLTQDPNATDLQICRGLDADGSAELPAGWNVNRGDRSFVGAYSNREARHKIEIAISKIRADLREARLLRRR